MIENPFMTIDEKIEDLEIKLEITNGIKSACKISFVFLFNGWSVTNGN